MKNSLMLKGAKVIVEVFGGVKKGESVLILCDSTTEDLSEALTSIVLLNEAEPFVLTMKPRKVHGEQLPEVVASAMKSADLVIAPTKCNIAHTKARFDATKAGARIVVLPEAQENLLCKPALFADFIELKPRIEKLAQLLTNAETAKITSPLGTDFICSIKGREGRALHGIANLKDISAGFGVEASIAPVEDQANGIIIVNESIPGIGLVDKPITTKFKDGICYEIEGGKIAESFLDLLNSKNDPNIFTVAELGIGMNPLSKFENDMLSDESVYGSIHVAIGTNAYIGGKTVAAGHYDMVFTGATLELDGEVVIENGNVLV